MIASEVSDDALNWGQDIPPPSWFDRLTTDGQFACDTRYSAFSYHASILDSIKGSLPAKCAANVPAESLPFAER